MKTLFLFIKDYNTEESFFFTLEGDYSRLNNVFIDCFVLTEKWRELENIVFNEDNTIKVDKLEQPTKDWDFFVKCGINETYS